MRMYIFGGSRTIGGVEVFNRRLANLVRFNGVQGHLLRLNSHRIHNPFFWLCLYIFSVAIGIFHMWFRRSSLMVVSAGNFFDVLAALTFAMLGIRRDIILIAHFNSMWRFFDHPVLINVFRYTSKRIRVHCIAPSQKRDFVSRGIVVEEDIFPNFIWYSGYRTSVATQHYRPGNPVKAVFIGRVIPEKRVGPLASFLSLIASDDLPIDLEVVGDCSLAMAEIISANEAPNFRVIFRGSLPEIQVSQVLREASFFCSFSSTDTLPLNMLEAAAHGLPILTVRNPVTLDVSDIVGDLIFVEEREPPADVRKKIRSRLFSPVESKDFDFVADNNRRALEVLGISRE